MSEVIHRKKRLSSFKLIVLGFAGVILLGALILMLPFSSTAGVVTPFHEALFTSTSAVCVTGLVVQDTGSYWSAFGQTVILLLIQIGGLGVVTVAATFAMLSGRKISLMQRSTMQDAISAPKVGGIVRLTRFIVDVYKRQIPTPCSTARATPGAARPLTSYEKGRYDMRNIVRDPDDIRIVCDKDNADCTVNTAIEDGKLYV